MECYALEKKGNRRNSKQRPTAAVCAAIERFLCSKKEFTLADGGAEAPEAPGNATPWDPDT